MSCGEAPQPPGSPGSEAPVYAAPTMRGDSVSLASLKGSVVLFNIWATWCIPCRREIPELQALHQQFSGQGLRVLGVSVDDAGSDADVAEFARNFSMTYTILRDPHEAVTDAFRLPGVPATFLIDRAGVIRWKRLGAFKADDADFQAALQDVL